MFGQHTQNFPVFGDMQYKSYWIGEMEIPAFSAQAEVIVRAKKEGITQAQIQAMQDFLVHQQKIQQQAVNELVELMQEGGLEVSAENLWQDLQLEQIEVTDEHYDAETQAISILLLFSSEQCEDFCPAIEVINGQLHQVLSGT